MDQSPKSFFSWKLPAIEIKIATGFSIYATYVWNSLGRLCFPICKMELWTQEHHDKEHAHEKYGLKKYC
jgi:hypothetical protein